MSAGRRAFLRTSAAAGLGAALSRDLTALRVTQPAPAARLQLLRHATCRLHYAGRVLLVDPMLGEPGVMPAIANSPNPRPNPLTPLPIAADRVLAGADAILVTHTHADHWDAAATKLVPKQTRLFIQPPDAAKFTQWGFTDAHPVETSTTWSGVTIVRTGGQHGRGEVARRLAPVSGFVLNSPGAPTIYIAGDTVWCPDVATVIETHKPQVIVVNAGAAQFLEGGPITMDANDVREVCRAAPAATVVAIHMEAINHCVLTRAALRDAIGAVAGKPDVRIPGDGEELVLA